MNMMIPLWFSNETQIDFVFPQKLKSMVGRLTFNGDPDVRMLGDKLLQIGKKHIFTQGRGNADMEVPDSQFIYFFQPFLSCLKGVKGSLYVVVQELSFFSKLYPTGVPGKQCNVQALLQLPDRFTDGRLADKKLCGCF